jgi:hypothetical protein
VPAATWAGTLTKQAEARLRMLLPGGESWTPQQMAAAQLAPHQRQLCMRRLAWAQRAELQQPAEGSVGSKDDVGATLEAIAQQAQPMLTAPSRGAARSAAQAGAETARKALERQWQDSATTVSVGSRRK